MSVRSSMTRFVPALALVLAAMNASCSDPCANTSRDVKALHAIVLRDQAKLDRIGEMFDLFPKLGFIVVTRSSVLIANLDGHYIETPLSVLAGSAPASRDQAAVLAEGTGLESVAAELASISAYLTSVGIREVERIGPGVPGDELHAFVDANATGLLHGAYISIARAPNGLHNVPGSPATGFTRREWCNPTRKGDIRWMPVVGDWYIFVKWE